MFYPLMLTETLLASVPFSDQSMSVWHSWILTHREVLRKTQAGRSRMQIQAICPVLLWNEFVFLLECHVAPLIK